MADTHETIADIIAEMRRRIAVKMSDAWYTQEEWRKLCDRLEAAWKREKAAIEADALAVGGIVGASHMRELSKNVSKNGADFGQLGDAAKLREALEYMFILIDGRHLVLECKTTEEISGVQGKLAEARAALAAPPRNCDRFETAEEVDAAYRRFCEREIAKIPMDAVDYSRERAKIPTKDKWLFAPTTEKEGGNDAD